MEFEMSRDRLRRYFSEITYIDDKFDCTCDELEPAEDMPEDQEGPPVDVPEDWDEPPIDLPQEASERELLVEAEIAGSDEPIELNLLRFLRELNTPKYDGITVRPVLYTQDMGQEAICKQIGDAHLTVIDWDLGPQTTAFPVIDQILSQSGHLEVFVVYTAGYLDAMNSLRENPNFSRYDVKDDSSYADISYCLCERKSMIVIAGKQHHSIPDLVNIIVEKFIQTWGIMPVAVLEYMQNAQDISDKLFSSFSNPVSELYSLQMHFSEINETDSSEMLTQFLQNKFRDACTTDPRIIRELFEFQRNKLAQFAENPDAQSKLKECIGKVLPDVADQSRDIITYMQGFDIQQFLDVCRNLSDKETWPDVFSAFDGYFVSVQNSYVKSIVTNTLSAYDGIELPEEKQKAAEESRLALEKRIDEEVTPLFEKIIRERFPVIIQMLISTGDILGNSAEFVTNLKYKEYKETSLRAVLARGKKLNSIKKAEFLHNKLHFGDVLTRKGRQGMEYLLCITPPCDLFRPDKVKFNILYIGGVELSCESLRYPRKESSHISILPVANDAGEKELKYIEWRFYDVKKFGLNGKESYEELCGWTRPYMMCEPYVRQISNKFIAFYSRAGVDEVFFKSETSLRTLFH